MKYLYLVILFLMISCSENKNSKFNGEWMLVKFDGVSCNVCSKFVFNSDYYGLVNRLSKEVNKFRYNIIDDKITLSFEEPISYFGQDSVFNFKLGNLPNHENLKFLELTSVNDQSKYLFTGIRTKE